MTEASKVVPIKSERTRKVLRHAQRTPATPPVREPGAAPTIPARAEHGTELVREKARLGQVVAEIALLDADIEALAERKRSLGRIEQSVRAKIAVLEEPAREVSE